MLSITLPQNSSEMKDLLQMISFLLGITGVVSGVAWKWVIKPFVEFLKAEKAFRVVLHTALKDISAIKAEVTPNHGSSIKDAISRLEEGQNMIRKHQTENSYLFRALLTDAPHGVMITNSEGELEWVNRTLLGRVKLSIEQVKGTGWLSFIADEDKERVYRGWLAACNEGREFMADYNCIDVEHHYIPVKTHVYPVNDDLSSVSKYLGIVEFKDCPQGVDANGQCPIMQILSNRNRLDELLKA